MSTTTPLGFIVPVDADAPNGPLEIGGNAETADALLQKGGVGGHFLSAAKLTRASATLGAFSTPVKVTLPRVTADQTIEIVLYTILLGGATTETRPQLALSIGGSVILESPPTFTTAAEWFAVGLLSPLKPAFSHGEGLSEAAAKEGAEVATTLLVGGESVRAKHKSSEATAVAVELLGKQPTGSATIYGAYLAARVRA